MTHAPILPNATRLTRRSALLGLTAAVTLGRSSLAVASAPTNRRLIVIIMRGAMDGMAAVIPYGDPALAALRGPLIPPAVGTAGGMADLGGFFGLNPVMQNMAAMYAAGELLPVHAIAGHYRTRSHFEAQDYMESGADQRLTSGWLNRVVAQMPQGGAINTALSVGIALPLLLRGTAPVGAWAPQSFGQPQADLYARIVALHHNDRLTGPAIEQGLRERGFTGIQLANPQPDEPRNRNTFPALASAAGKLLAAPDGPRIAAMEIGGWDTHAGQMNRLAGPLRELDAGIAAIKASIGDAWRDTVVLTMTEFGRTVRMNGTQGTDHGTATVAFVAGGRVAGGRVLADWPGLGTGQLFENRDLAPTMDLRSVVKGLLMAHLGVTAEALNQVFPGSDGVQPTRGLLRA